MKLVLPILLGAGAAVLGGCGVPDYHWHVAKEGQVNMHLGPVSQQCSLSSAGTGVSEDDGSVVTYTHHVNGDSCVMNTTWRGKLMDYSSVRSEALGEVHDIGNIDETEITRFNLKLEAVRLKDLAPARDVNLNVADTSMEKIHAAVFVGGEKALGAEFDTHEFNDDPDHPDEFVADPTALVSQAQKAWKNHDDLDATGDSEIQVTLTGVDGFAEAEDPALVLEYQLDVTGNEIGSDPQHDGSSIY